MKKSVVTIALVSCLFTLFFSSCGQDETITYQLNSKLVQLKCDNTFALEITPTLAGLIYTSLNTNIATVSTKGLIKAKLVGTTKIVVKDSLNHFVDTVNVVVSTVFTSYSDPHLVFGASKDELVKTFDLNVYNYTYYENKFFNYLYFYELGATTTRVYYDYYLSKDNKMVIADVELQDNGELDWHIASRYSQMRSFVHTTRYLNSDSTYSVYNYVDTYYTNPDSSLIVLNRSSGDSYKTMYYFAANEENIQRVLNTNEDKGTELYYWFFSPILDPEIDYTLYSLPKKKPAAPNQFFLPTHQRQ